MARAVSCPWLGNASACLRGLVDLRLRTRHLNQLDGRRNTVILPLTMGAAASIPQYTDEIAKPLDGSDIDSPESAKAEVVRLRALLAASQVPTSPTLAVGGFDLTGESYEQLFAQVAPGCWSICTQHHPGNMAAMPKHNNRAMVFTIKDPTDGDFLFMYGIPDSAFIPNAKAVEAASGLTIKYIMSSGCWHHLYLEDWMAAFPLPVSFLMTSAKFPETRNGQKLLAAPDTKGRIEVYDTEVPHLTKYADQVQFVVMDQLTTYTDKGAFAGTKDLVQPDQMGEVMKLFVEPQTQRFAAVTLYHVATKTCVIDHNFDMFQPGDVWDKQSPMEQGFHPRHTLRSQVHNGSQVVDPAKNVAQIQQMLALDCRSLMDLHTAPTYNVMDFTDQAAYVTELTRVWTDTGEMDPTGEALMYKKAKAKEE